MDTRPILALLLLALVAGCGATTARRAPLIAAPTASATPPAPQPSPMAAATPAAPPQPSATPAVRGTPAPPTPAAPGEGRVGEPLELALGEEALVAGADLALRFEAVVEDSRCPADVQCIWAGRVVIAVEARVGAGPPESLTLGLPGGITPDAPELQPAGDHTVRLLSVDPHPPTSDGPPLPYVATLIVEGR